MTDIVTYCDIYKCEDCPRYGDDCDGSTERLYTHKEAWGMTDLISRADAIAYIDRVIKSGLGRNKSLDYIHKYISALPSAEADWIPCSERLPKAEDMYQPPEQRYLCQLEAHGVRKFCVLSRLKGAVSPFWDWYGIAVYDSDVIAWMPLPKPYKVESEE